VGGRYWLDVALGNQDVSVMLDLGLVDSLHRVGFEVDPTVYDLLMQTGQLVRVTRRSRRDASGQLTWSSSGLTNAQLICPVARQRVGPVVSVHVSRGATGVPSRVGVVFFHLLSGCRVDWDLDQREWCVAYP
jgi:hypothetical protein